MPERLKATPEIPFWKGKDSLMKETVTIPGESPKLVKVFVPHGGLPDFLADNPEECMRLYASTRSILAQCGVDVDDHGTELYEAIRENPDLIRDPSGFDISVRLVNHSRRDITLTKDLKVFRSYHAGSRPRLSNGELVSAFRNREIVIDGEQGSDWDWAYENGRKDRIVGAYVRIQPERKWMHADDNSSPIVIPADADRSYRSEIDKLLVPVPETTRFKHWVGETVSMKLAENVNGILRSVVLPNMSGKGERHGFGTHVNSHLIDGGSDWPIRVEVISSTDPELMPNFAYFYFVKAS